MSQNLDQEFFGVVDRDIADERDFSIESIYSEKKVGEPPLKLDLRDKLPKPKDQGQRGTCAAHTASAIKEYQECVDLGLKKPKKMSPEFVYFFRDNKPDEGMYPRDVMKILKEKGICFERSLRYSSDKRGVKKVPQEAIDEASNYKIANYARVTTIQGLRQTLYQDGVCYISFPVYDVRPEFWRRSSNKVERRGGHAVAVVGYNSKGFIIRNSWGDNWNGNGHVIYPYEDFGAHWDIWAAVDIKGSPKPSFERKKRGEDCAIF